MVTTTCETQTVDGQIVLVRCAETGAEGIWSGSEYGTVHEWRREHEEAHRRMREAAYVGPPARGRMLFGLRYS